MSGEGRLLDLCRGVGPVPGGWVRIPCTALTRDWDGSDRKPAAHRAVAGEMMELTSIDLQKGEMGRAASRGVEAPLWGQSAIRFL